MSERRNVPKLRFPWFRNQWILSDFGKIANVIDCKHRTPQYVEEGIPVISPGTIKWGPLDTILPTKRVSESNYQSLMDHCSPQVGDFILSRNQSVGVASIIVNDEKFVLGQDTVLVNPFASKPFFLYYCLQTAKTQTSIIKQSGGSTFSRINLSEIRKLKIAISEELNEQQKIATFLTAVDRRIALLEQKKEKLEAYKKGVMQQLFSRQIRFKQDDGSDFPEWEEKKLGEVAKFSKGKGISKSDISESGELECIRYGQLYTEYGEVIDQVVSRTNIEDLNLVISRANDVIIPSSGETQIDIARAACVLRSGIALGGDLNIIRSQLNGVFLSFYLNHRRKHQIAKMAQGISVVHLYNSQLVHLEIEIPCPEEQGKIVSFLRSLDETTEKMTHQINQTQTWKKGLLQQMFV